MEKNAISKSLLMLSALLRTSMTGGVFLLSFCYSRDRTAPLENLRSLTESGVLALALALIFGVLIHLFHRAVPNPLIELGRHALIGRQEKWWPWIRAWLAPGQVFRATWRRWLYLSDSKDAHTPITAWGHCVHLQYCAAWALGFGSLTAWIISTPDMVWSFNPWLWCFGIAAFVAGLISDVRKHVMEQWLYRVNDRVQQELNNAKHPSVMRELRAARSTPLFPSNDSTD